MESQKSKLAIKIFADGADLSVIKRLKEAGLVKGFTTNPSLMRKAGVQDYKIFAEQVIEMAPDLPLSLEVFSDNLEEMEAQARTISSWGKNVFVKIPVMNTQRTFTGPILTALSRDGIKLNVTALMSVEQSKNVLECLRGNTPIILSIFSGRIADTGRDPIPIIAQCVDLLQNFNNIELLWASTRELLNVVQADKLGCDIITVGEDILDKIDLIGKDLDDFSRETVEMFYNDALGSKFKI